MITVTDLSLNFDGQNLFSHVDLKFTPGNCYEETSNGNTSAIHWDLVWIQRPEYGGGEIYFDDVLIRKDGRFVVPELGSLNPEHLK